MCTSASRLPRLQRVARGPPLNPPPDPPLDPALDSGGLTEGEASAGELDPRMTPLGSVRAAPVVPLTFLQPLQDMPTLTYSAHTIYLS